MEHKDLFITRFNKGNDWSIDAILKVINNDNYVLVNLKTSKCDNTIMVLECTESSYKAFSKVVEKMYPGVCDFDI